MQGSSRVQLDEGPLDEIPPEGLRKIWRWAALDTGVLSAGPLSGRLIGRFGRRPAESTPG